MEKIIWVIMKYMKIKVTEKFIINHKYEK